MKCISSFKKRFEICIVYIAGFLLSSLVQYYLLQHTSRTEGNLEVWQNMKPDEKKLVNTAQRYHLFLSIMIIK